MAKRNLFGTSGIRGDAQSLFTNQFCFDIGRAFARFLTAHKQNGEVAVGMDPRPSSPRIKDGLISGLNFEGRKVNDQGVVPIPSLNYLLKVSPSCAGSIMISGSHIKTDLNGLKFFAFGEEINKENEKEIEKIYFELENQKQPIGSNHKLVSNEEKAKEEYINYLIREAVKPLPGWKIVVDAGNGAQSEVMPEVLKKLDLEVIEINTSIQANLLSRDSEVEGDFAELQKKVKEKGADLGIGYDSDGDRVVFVDEKGTFIPGDYSGTLIAREISPEVTVTPINTSQVVEKVIAKVYRTKVGSPYVVAKMKTVGAAFGFEANGGGIFNQMYSRDGGRTTITLLNILTKHKKPLSRLVSELPRYFLARDKVEYRWEFRDKIIQAAKEKFQGSRIDQTDGLKIWLDEENWILFRSSQNAPEFRVFAESRSATQSRQMLKEGLELVKEMIKNGISVD